MIAKRIYQEFPDRHDRQLWIGDGCTAFGYCPRHLPTTHFGGKTGRKEFDVNYFTLAEFNPDIGQWGNATQYNTGAGGGWTEIWTDNNPDNMVLDTSLFDWERNFYFLKYLMEAFPGFYAVLHEKAWEYMKSKTKQSVWQPMVPRITEEGGHKMKHRTHMHIDAQNERFS